MLEEYLMMLGKFSPVFRKKNRFLALIMFLWQNKKTYSEIIIKYSVSSPWQFQWLCIRSVFINIFLISPGKWGNSSEFPYYMFSWGNKKSFFAYPIWPRWLKCPFDWYQELAGLIPAWSTNILPWRLVIKYILRSFSPFWFKKDNVSVSEGQCQCQWRTMSVSVKECAQVLVNLLED